MQYFLAENQSVCRSHVPTTSTPGILAIGVAAYGRMWQRNRNWLSLMLCLICIDVDQVAAQDEPEGALIISAQVPTVGLDFRPGRVGPVNPDLVRSVEPPFELDPPIQLEANYLRAWDPVHGATGASHGQIGIGHFHNGFVGAVIVAEGTGVSECGIDPYPIPPSVEADFEVRFIRDTVTLPGLSRDAIFSGELRVQGYVAPGGSATVLFDNKFSSNRHWPLRNMTWTTPGPFDFTFSDEVIIADAARPNIANPLYVSVDLRASAGTGGSTSYIYTGPGNHDNDFLGVCQSYNAVFPPTPSKVLTNSVDRYFVSPISGSNVIWSELVGGNRELFLFDGNSTNRITDNALEENEVQLSGSNVAWLASDGNDDEVYFYDGQSMQQLSDNDVKDQNVRISGSNVVWRRGNNLTSRDIVLFDGATHTILADDAYVSAPLASGQKVAWIEDIAGNDQLMLYDGATTTQLTDNVAGESLDLRGLSGDNIVWRAATKTLLFDGDNTIELTGAPHTAIFSDSMAAWSGTDGNDLEVFVYDGETILQLTDNLEDDFIGHGSISGNSLVWWGSDGHDREIFRYDGTTIRQITNNSIDDFAAHTDGVNIAWSAKVDEGLEAGGNVNNEIFLYDGDNIGRLTRNPISDLVRGLAGSNIIWTNSSGGIILHQEIPQIDNSVARLVAGSPVSISQLVEIPDVTFDLSVDYLFETPTGLLTVYLDGEQLGTLTPPAEIDSEMRTASFPIDDDLLNRVDLLLEFIFDGPTGSAIQLDNVEFPNFMNGDFQLDDFTGWAVDSSQGGSAGVIRLSPPDEFYADFDGDGDVDGADFLKWQRGESPNPFSTSDLAEWELNIGASDTVSSTTTIPEPSTLLLSALAAVGLLIRRWSGEAMLSHLLSNRFKFSMTNLSRPRIQARCGTICAVNSDVTTPVSPNSATAAPPVGNNSHPTRTTCQKLVLFSFPTRKRRTVACSSGGRVSILWTPLVMSDVVYALHRPRRRHQNRRLTLQAHWQSHTLWEIFALARS